MIAQQFGEIIDQIGQFIKNLGRNLALVEFQQIQLASSISKPILDWAVCQKRVYHLAQFSRTGIANLLHLINIASPAQHQKTPLKVKHGDLRIMRDFSRVFEATWNLWLNVGND